MQEKTLQSLHIKEDLFQLHIYNVTVSNVYILNVPKVNMSRFNSFEKNAS